MSRDITKYQHINQQDYKAASGPDWPDYSVFQQHLNIADKVYDEIDARLKPPTAFEHPSFCVLPFYGWEYPRNVPCCLIAEPYKLSHLQKDMLAGLRPKNCQACWNLEDAGIKSDRQLKNETLDFYLDRNIKDLLQDCQQKQNKIVHYKIDTNNICNATCVTCGSDNSSSWAQLERKNQQVARRRWQIQPQRVDRIIDYATAKLITFRGGEPLLSDSNFHVLEQLLLAGNTDCFISFQTNGSITPSSKQEKLLLQFKNLNFSFSIDGVGPVFEYVRYPLKWNDLLKNINWCRQRNIEVSVCYTLSNLNVFYHQQTLQWFKNNQINYLINPVYDPACFSPSALPRGVKDQIDYRFTHTDNDDNNYIEFRQKIAQQDIWKGIRMQDYLPELAELLG